jgi:1-deoxy-D-xylulose-5-phosphate reductoisomerase
VLSGANEALVYAFLQGRIKLGRISEGLEAALAAHENIAQPNLEEIIQADAWARRFAADWLAKNC